ncbi:MAG: DUF3817 domain-containing protein [Actinobacteria bacterium]|nr:DUF3817 domain-containing protein [Actinomycetota bacterium]
MTMKLFRIFAWVTGIFLLFNVVVALPYKYMFDGTGQWTAITWQIHGFLYMAYVVVTFNLSRKAEWDLKRTVLFLIAGTIPMASFFADRRARALIG